MRQILLTLGPFRMWKTLVKLGDMHRLSYHLWVMMLLQIFSRYKPMIPPFYPTTHTKALPSHATTYTPRSSRATPSSGYFFISLTLALSLETRMATLLQHVKPWV